jgi:hypothetical protein
MASPTLALLPRGGNSKNNREKKVGGNNQLLASAPTAAAATAVGDEVHRVTSAPTKHPAVMMVVPVARCTTPCATALESAEKSRSSWNGTASS